jgi:hypothetical protein
MWIFAVAAFVLLCLATLTLAAFTARKSMSQMVEWQQGLCGTSIILGFLGCLASVYILFSGVVRVGEPLILPLVILISLLCPVALLLGVIVRTKTGYLLIVAEVLQVLFLFALFGSGGIL